MLFPFLTVFIIFLVLLAIRYNQTKKKQAEIQDSFWEAEARANAAPPANLDDLQYITIPLEKFPLGFSKEEKILAIEDKLTVLSQKRLLNLTGMTNTELKTIYGVSNFNAVSEMGEDFDSLTVLLKEYAETLIEAQLIGEAIQVLEYGVGIGTDISRHYIMLGECYQVLHKTEKLEYLIEQVSSSSLLLAPSICRQLTQLLHGDTESEIEAPENFPL